MKSILETIQNITETNNEEDPIYDIVYEIYNFFSFELSSTDFDQEIKSSLNFLIDYMLDEVNDKKEITISKVWKFLDTKGHQRLQHYLNKNLLNKFKKKFKTKINESKSDKQELLNDLKLDSSNSENTDNDPNFEELQAIIRGMTLKNTEISRNKSGDTRTQECWIFKTKNNSVCYKIPKSDNTTTNSYFELLNESKSDNIIRVKDLSFDLNSLEIWNNDIPEFHIDKVDFKEWISAIIQKQNNWSKKISDDITLDVDQFRPIIEINDVVYDISKYWRQIKNKK